MAELKHVQIVKQGRAALAAWRLENPVETLDLRRADLSGTNLNGCDLSGANLRFADLSKCDLKNTRLNDCDLRHCSFRDAKLSTAAGFTKEMLAGADVRGAELPATINEADLTLPPNLPEAVECTRHLFWWMLAVCFFCWLSIGATHDGDLIVNQGRLPLPIFNVDFPVVTFYWVAPVLLIGMYIYFHLYLQRQWDVVAQQPAVSQAGVPLDQQLHGWIVLGLVRKHFAQLTHRPPWFRMQATLCTFLVWWVVPVTVFAFWWRYTRRHDVIGSVWLIAMTALALHCAQTSWSLATRTLRGEHLPKFGWIQHSLTAGAVVVLWTLTMLAVTTDVPIALLDADLVNSELSSPPEDWPALTSSLPEPRDDTSDLTAILFASAISQTPTPVNSLKDWHGELATNLQNAEEIERTSRRLYRHVRGARLLDANLKGANLQGAFLGRANLANANLRGASMSATDLGWARLTDASLADVKMWNATLIGANLSQADGYGGTFSNCIFIGADVSGAFLMEAYMTNSDFRRADLQGTIFTNANLSFARFNGANFAQAKLAGADLRGADLRGAIALRKSQLVRAKTDARTLLPEFDEAGISLPLASDESEPVAAKPLLQR